MPTIVQRSFAKGELSPALHGRADLVMYSLGAKTLENVYVPEEGGAEIRPGTQFITELLSSTSRPKLLGFDFNESYCLVFSHLRMNVIKNGAAVIARTLTITGISNASTGVVTSVLHQLNTDDVVYLSGIVGMTELNGRWVRVGTTTADTFQIKTLAGVAINTTGFTAYSSGGTADLAYSLTTTYDKADVNDLHFNQSANTITVTHQSYPVRNIVRVHDDSWSIADVNFSVQTGIPGSLYLTVDDGTHLTPGTPLGYSVTSINDKNEESEAAAAVQTTCTFQTSGQYVDFSWAAVAGAKGYRVYKHLSYLGTLGFVGSTTSTSYHDGFPGAVPDFTVTPPINRDPFNRTASISGITRANPGVISATGHGFIDGEKIKITGVVGMTEINDLTAYVDYINSGAFSLTDIDGSPIDTSGYTAYSSGGTASSLDTYPKTSGYYQERLVLANQSSKEMKVITSKTGLYRNFSQSFPIRDDDGVEFDCIGRNGGEIRHIVDAGTLILLTSKGEHICQGDASGVLKPDAVNRKQFSYHGSSTIQPLVSGQTVLTIQAEGSKIINLGFDQKSGGIDGYRDGNITATSAHLFKGYTLLDWCLQKTPNSIVWAVRSDGVLLGMTFEKDQEVIAWHKHETDGRVESVCCVPENGEHIVYLAVRRFIGNDLVGRVFIERMYPQSVFKNSTEMFLTDIGTVYLDSSLTYDGRNTNATNTMWLTGGSTWGHEETLTLHSANSTFTSADVGREIHLQNTTQDELLRLEIKAYTSSTQVSVRPNRTVPASLRNIGNASFFWARAVKNVSGLHHLEGKEVSIIADAMVIGSPNDVNNDTIYTISGGAVTPSLNKCYSVISVGLPYIATIQTLDIDAAQTETLMDKKKCVSRVTLRVKDSRGIYIGSSEPTGDDPLEGLNELKLRNSEGYDSANELKTGLVDINIQPEMNNNGSIIIRQVDPLPMTVLSVGVSGMIPMGR